MASLSKIKQDVRVILYRNEGYDPLTDVEGMENIDNLKVEELVDTLIGVAVDKVYALAPAWMLGEIASTIDTGDGDEAGGSIGWNDDEDEYASIAVAPNDMLRIVMVKLPKWKKPVTDMTSFDDALYAEYRSEFEGVRPTTLYPAVAVGPNWNGDGVRIEAYPKGASQEGSAKPSVRYIRKFDAAQDIAGDEVNLAGRVYYSVLYYIASLFYVSLGDKTRADMMEAEAIKLLNYQVEDK